MASGTIVIDGVHMRSRYIKKSGGYEHRIVQINGSNAPNFPGRARLKRLANKILSTQATIHDDAWARITTEKYVSELDRWLLLSAILYYCR